MIGGQATRTWISFALPDGAHHSQERFHRRTADDGIFHQNHPLAFQHLAQRCVLGANAGIAVLAFDEGATHVAVTHQPFDGGQLQRKRHRIGCSLGRIRNGYHDGVVIERHHAEFPFLVGQFDAQGIAGEIDTVAIEFAGDVGEVDPFEEAVLGRLLGSKSFDAELPFLNDDDLARLPAC